MSTPLYNTLDFWHSLDKGWTRDHGTPQFFCTNNASFSDEFDRNKLQLYDLAQQFLNETQWNKVARTGADTHYVLFKPLDESTVYYIDHFAIRKEFIAWNMARLSAK